jgi:O-antigen ligase
MAVPAFGGLAYLILCKNWKLLFVGLIVMGSTYGVLRYTFIANEIYEVRRMRMAVIEGSDNASFQVRRTNQKRLSIYLKNRPFGGGIGSAGYWGGRFSSGTFLAELALDSWYVKIWAEYGITGLISYLLMLGGLVFFSLKTLLREQDPYLRQTMLAAFCGLIGILAASYGNQVFGQIPTGVIVPVSLIFLVRNPDSKA